MIDGDRLIATIRDRGGLESSEEATHATEDVLRALAERLTAGAARRLAESLPTVAAIPLRRAGSAGARGDRRGRGGSTDDFLAEVARSRGTGDLATAGALVQAVLRTIAEAADDDAVTAARGQLTAELRGLLAQEHEEEKTATVVGSHGPGAERDAAAVDPPPGPAVPSRAGPISIEAGEVSLTGDLALPEEAVGAVVLAHASASSRHSPDHRFVAERLRGAGLATLLIDLLAPQEEATPGGAADRRFDIARLARPMLACVDRLAGELPTAGLPVGALGVGAAGGAALIAAAERPDQVRAVVSRGGRPDLLAVATLRAVTAPVLLIIGSDDTPAIEMSTGALSHLRSREESTLEVIAGATDRFEEPGALEVIADLASSWFKRQLGAGMPTASEAAGG